MVSKVASSVAERPRASSTHPFSARARVLDLERQPPEQCRPGPRQLQWFGLVDAIGRRLPAAQDARGTLPAPSVESASWSRLSLSRQLAQTGEKTAQTRDSVIMMNR
jgi:hypothetical protein